MTRYMEMAQEAIVKQVLLHEYSRQMFFDHWQSVISNLAMVVDPVHYATGYLQSLHSPPPRNEEATKYRRLTTEAMVLLLADAICKRVGKERLW